MLIFGDLPSGGFIIFGFAAMMANMAEIRQVINKIVNGTTSSKLFTACMPIAVSPEPKRAIIKVIKIEFKLIIIAAFLSAIDVRFIWLRKITRKRVSLPRPLANEEYCSSSTVSKYPSGLFGGLMSIILLLVKSIPLNLIK